MCPDICTTAWDHVCVLTMVCIITYYGVCKTLPVFQYEYRTEWYRVVRTSYLLSFEAGLLAAM
jgi:hypothetical protein